MVFLLEALVQGDRAATAVEERVITLQVILRMLAAEVAALAALVVMPLIALVVVVEVV
jgi:hypothetical protein